MAARTTIQQAIRIGELLTAAKSKLAHGQWLPWVEKNLPFDRRTATNYMGIYQQREKWENVSHLNISDAYRLLASPRELQVQKFKGHDAQDFIDNLPDAETLAGDLSVAGREKFEAIRAQTFSLIDSYPKPEDLQTVGECLKYMRKGRRLADYWHAVTTHCELFLGMALTEIEAAKTGRTP